MESLAPVAASVGVQVTVIEPGAVATEFVANIGVDVPAVLASWHADGIGLYVYSSGSVRNQQDWFANARGGELASLISGWFDLTTAGPKRERSSYDTIAKAIGLPADQILLLSDHPDELDAAVSAGRSVLGLARPGEPNSPRPPHRWIDSFTEVDLRRL